MLLFKVCMLQNSIELWKPYRVLLHTYFAKITSIGEMKIFIYLTAGLYALFNLERSNRSLINIVKHSHQILNNDHVKNYLALNSWSNSLKWRKYKRA